MIDCYMNQEVTWYRLTGHSGKEPIFDAGTAISVRWDDVTRRVRDEAGVTITVQGAIVTTSFPVKAGDKLEKDGKGWIIPAVGKIPDLDGQEQFREVVF